MKVYKVKFTVSMFLVLKRQQRKSQKYFELLTFNMKINHSNMLTTLGAMNFQKWEIFLAHLVLYQV